MEIHPATTNDIPELCSLLESLFDQEAEFEANYDIQAHGLSLVINDPKIGVILIARESDKVIAMVNILYTVSTALGDRVGILEDMVVSPKERGSGLGSKLLSYALAYAKKKGCKRLTLLTDHDNIDAQRFYQHHGFSNSDMVPLRISLDDK